MNEPCVQILMACFNGEKFVAAQIDSILRQTYTHWHLTIRDDGSQDDTKTVLETYCRQHPQKISLLTDGAENVGSVLNFNLLLQQVKDEDYIMFCDQDDVWHEDKIEITLSELMKMENEYGRDCPLLVFTNFLYVDDAIQTIESKKDFEINTLPDFGFVQLLAANPVYGCTCILNRALSQKIGNIPAEAENHDYWTALTAAAFGKISYLKEKTVLYRQHGGNISGQHNNDSFRKRLFRNIIQRKNFGIAKKKYEMLALFRERYGHDLKDRYAKALSDTLCFFTRKNIACLYCMIKAGVRCQTIPQTVLYYLTVLFIKNPVAKTGDQK